MTSRNADEQKREGTMKNQPTNLQPEEQREAARREARLRRLARECGLELKKSRYQSNAGTYQLRNPRTNSIGFWLNLDDVENYLTELPPIRRDNAKTPGGKLACGEIKMTNSCTDLERKNQ